MEGPPVPPPPKATPPASMKTTGPTVAAGAPATLATATPGQGDGDGGVPLLWFGLGGVGLLLGAAVVVVRTLRR
jgi:hypothetical protein